MIEWLDKIDKSIFIYFNSKNSPLSDTIWYWITDIPSWIPFYILISLLIFYKFRYDGFWLMGGILLTVLICDQFTFSFMKPFFARPRPCYSPDLADLVHVVKQCGGRYGFASGHAANSFGIATFVWLTFRHIWKPAILIYIWSALIAFSRIMVGVHYPGDILTGSILGIIFGILTFRLVGYLYFRFKHEPLIKN